MGDGSPGWLMTIGVAMLYVATAGAQTAGFDRHVIVLDPAHGGSDPGGRIGNIVGEPVQEKDVTLAFAARLRTLLIARGLNVVMTRVSDLDAGSLDQRAEMANRSRAVACLVVHASASTHGVVLGTSALGTALAPSLRESPTKPGAGVPWARAQEAYVAQSGRLANLVGTSLSRSGLETSIMRVAMRPLDNLTCAAISVELGVPSTEGADSDAASGDRYRQSVAESLADALALWRKEAQAPEDLPALEGAASLKPVLRPGHPGWSGAGATP